jgi:hypothetical protein
MPTCAACLRMAGVAMISTLLSVWLRPAVLGGFGGMSDRFNLLLLSSVRLVLMARRREKVSLAYHCHGVVTGSARPTVHLGKGNFTARRAVRSAHHEFSAWPPT